MTTSDTRTGYWLLALCALLAVLFLSGCIPVTVRPQFDAENKPIAIPVTPVGSISPDGTLNPIYPVSSKAPTDANWGSIGAVIGAITTALVAAYGTNVRGVASKAKTAIGIMAQLAEDNGRVETNDEVAANVKAAQALLKKHGVETLVEKSKPI